MSTARHAGKQLQANVTFLLHVAGVVVAAAGVDVVTGHLVLAAAPAHAGNQFGIDEDEGRSHAQSQLRAAYARAGVLTGQRQRWSWAAAVLGGGGCGLGRWR
jgi:hypothetical protein